MFSNAEVFLLLPGGRRVGGGVFFLQKLARFVKMSDKRG